MEHIEERKGEEICDNNEVLAMMCIIATLQLFLGLNDRMEWLAQLHVLYSSIAQYQYTSFIKAE